jgi:Tol biopolymer transport system component
VYLLIPGGTPRQLTIDPGDDWSLTWSVDGREIFAEETRNDRTDFVLIDPDSGRTRTLFDDTLFNPRGLIPNGRHWYDPANGRLAVGLLKDGLANVWIGIAREHDVKPMKQLTAETEGGSYPAISPDGRLVAYQCTEGSSTHVCLIPVEGGMREQLTHEPGQSWVSGWAPDNDRIVYAARRNAAWNLAWVSRSSRQTHMLTSFTRPNQFVRYPAWAPGRDRIIFERSEVTGRIWTVEIP